VTVASHTLTFFLKGAQQLRSPRQNPVPYWDLHLVLKAVYQPPLESLERLELRWMSIKKAFLLGMALARQVGELPVSQECLHWNSGDAGVTLWLPRGLVGIDHPLAKSTASGGK